MVHPVIMNVSDCGERLLTLIWYVVPRIGRCSVVMLGTPTGPTQPEP